MDDYWNLASTVGQNIYINSDLLASRGTDWWTITPAIASTFIAALAFFLARNEANKTREHHRLSAKPLLQFKFEKKSLKVSAEKSNSKFTLKLVNDGLGPAIVKTIDFKIDGKGVYRQSIDEEGGVISDKTGNKDFTYFIQQALGAEEGVGSVIVPANYSIKINEEILMIYAVLDIAKTNFESAVKKIDIEVVYTSIYGDEEFTASYKGV